MTAPDWIGKKLSNRYVIEEMLGQGGMSAVYKASDPNLKRVVAIKLIHSHLSDDPDFVQRFEQEAAAVAQLRHPSIIQVYDFNQDNNVYYMVLEFVPGETFQAHLKRLNADDRRLPISKTVEYMADICEAVDYAHQRGMIHRDIKPANLMLNTQGQAILMDFGIAKIVGGQLHTVTGAVIGTAMYMSPEQIRGTRPDRRTDVYSLGVTLFEMVSGRPPFQADSAMTLMMMHINDPVPDLRMLNPDVPDDLIAVINKALAKDPNERYQTAAEMASALRKALGRIKSGASAEMAAPAATMVEAIPKPIASPEATFYESPPAPPEGTMVESTPLPSIATSGGASPVSAAVESSAARPVPSTSRTRTDASISMASFLRSGSGRPSPTTTGSLLTSEERRPTRVWRLTRSRRVHRITVVLAAAHAPRDRGPANSVLSSAPGLGPSQLKPQSVGPTRRSCRVGSTSCGRTVTRQRGSGRASSPSIPVWSSTTLYLSRWPSSQFASLDRRTRMRVSPR